MSRSKKAKGEELSRLEETEQTGQLNVTGDPGLDPRPEKAHQWDN